MHNVDLGCNQFVGLSSISIEFENNANSDANIDISTNLIDKSYFNEIGLIHTIPGLIGYTDKRQIVEFWKLDTPRPERITFTFHHAYANNVRKFSATLAFAKTQDAPQIMVRLYCPPQDFIS